MGKWKVFCASVVAPLVIVRVVTFGWYSFLGLARRACLFGLYPVVVALCVAYAISVLCCVNMVRELSAVKKAG